MNTPHPQDQNPERPTAATDPQEAEISGNVFECLKKSISSDEEDKHKLRKDAPLEDLPQTKRAGE